MEQLSIRQDFQPFASFGMMPLRGQFQLFETKTPKKLKSIVELPSVILILPKR